MEWTDEQKRAIELFNQGKNICLTGQAGTGKSALIAHFREVKKQGLFLTASTGIAASLIGGTTLHSWAGIGLGKAPKKTLAKQVRGAARDRWIRAKTLIIDEISMITGELFDKLDYIGKHTRKSDAPFGGIQVVAVGDFLQLPPVVEGKDNKNIFCFESVAWKEAGFVTILLGQIFRQKESGFLNALEEIRNAKILSPETKRIIEECTLRVLEPINGIMPTRLYCHRANVAAENKRELDKLPGPPIPFRADDYGYESQLNRCRLPYFIDLKIGAQVMYLINDTNTGLVNGSRGIVRDWKNGLPVVLFENGVKLQVGHFKEHIEEDGKLLASRLQLPLCLAWAITIHKSQGMTLDRAVVDVTGAFACGQIYVAMSRLRSKEGLALRGFLPSRVVANQVATAFYESLSKS